MRDATSNKRETVAGLRERQQQACEQRAFEDVTVLSRTCPSCGDANETTPAGRYSRGQWTVKTCRACRFTYVTSAPDCEALFDTLSWEKTSQLETERRPVGASRR